MLLIMTFCLLIMVSIIMLTIMIMSIMKKKKKKLNKMTPFECGFNSMSNKRLPFSSHFFIIGMMFLIFDIEIIIIMPMILTMKFSIMKSWMFTSFLMLTILILGLYHEWYNGMLKWTK
uniref:NADH dehydrogenase subunit 3 n=1 Tax=Batracomorphus fuscomaculatus TaxID=3045904 RepID=UPI00257C6EA3|nr:NADH dehydrogenase subunit 3 [Batracomorphus fuscomaculatus]WHE42631.1 NADH dehydrogenase subunit 3 [Batracomorphus fuscomaculatus]